MFFLYLIYVELYVRGRSSGFFLGKGKKSIDLESLVTVSVENLDTKELVPLFYQSSIF